MPDAGDTPESNQIDAGARVGFHAEPTVGIGSLLLNTHYGFRTPLPKKVGHFSPQYATHYLGAIGWIHPIATDRAWTQPQVTDPDELHGLPPSDS